MTVTQVHVAKSETPEGQPQRYTFFRLGDATDEDGKPVKVRQPVAQATMEQLEKDLSTVQHYIELVKGLTPA